ncbi:T9SS type A sorting domain-containing protein [candidate division WOR-3 bacterium]|nr:T9SS type A sorting domain-containing protein [candidate division WOR-3 bacterium]
MAGLLLFLLFSGFHQVGYIPRGRESAGRMLLGDTDRNGLLEIIFVSREDFYYKVLWFYEQEGATLFDFAVSDSMIIHNDTLDLYLWEVGDFDLDGLYDLAFYYGRWPGPTNGIAVYESPDSFSYPTQEVWRDTVGPPLVLPICVYDIDQDGLPDIVKDRATPHGYLGIYESIGDNQYDLIFADNPDTSGYDAPASTIAFGDFDLDGKIEFVMGGMSAGALGATYWIYESPADNTYERIIQGYVSTKNIKDCFSVPDADGDGKMEFVVKGFVVPTARIHAFIFEATGDNTYEIIKSFDLFGGHNSYYGGYSEAGDVDGDGIPEIVLEACQSVFIIKSAGNDSFYVWDTLPGNDGGSSIAIYDIDGNGLAEIIISGNNQTRIYEYVVGITEATEKVIQGSGLTIYPNPFYDKTMIRSMIPDAGFVIESISLKIYDISGRVVKDLTNNLAPHTLHHTSELLWDGKDENRRQLPNGVYFVRLESPSQRITEKVVKLK